MYSKHKEFLDKIESAFNNVIYRFKDMKEFLCVDINDMEHFIRVFYYNIDDIKYELLELEVGLRSLRDKLENG